MENKFFVLKNNIIFGPFDRNMLLGMLKQGKLQMSDLLSTDKKNWQSPAAVLNIIVPERIEKKADIPPAVIEKPPVKNNDVEFDRTATRVYIPPTEKPSFWKLLGTAVSAMGNANDYMCRFYSFGANSMLLGGVIMAVLSLLMTLLGCLLFSSCYNQPPFSIYIRCLITVLVSGGIYWGGNSLIRLIATAGKNKKTLSMEADFLCAMHGMLNTALITIVFNASFFVFNRSLFTMTTAQIIAVLATALLPLIFFCANIITAIRLNLMDSSQLPPWLSTLLAVIMMWITVPLAGLLLWAIYWKA